MGIGIGFGLLMGIFLILLAKHERGDHFDDYTYWEQDDGIRYATGTPLPFSEPGVK